MLRSLSIYPANPSPELLCAGSANIKAFPSTQSCTPSPFQSSGSLGPKFNDLARFRWWKVLVAFWPQQRPQSILPAFPYIMRNMGHLKQYFDSWQSQRRISYVYPYWPSFVAHKRHIQSVHLQFLGPQLWAAITAATTQFCNAIGDFLCDTHVLSNAACHILCCMLGAQEGSTDPSALGSLIISGRAGSTPRGLSGNHSVVFSTFSTSLDADIFFLVLS